MGKKREPKIDMSYQTFGAILLDTEDLDPIYSMLVYANLDDDVLARWLLAYWCYYHAGVSSYIAEKPANEFYLGMWRASVAKAPRGMERRHFWGKIAKSTIQGLQDAGAPERIVEHMCDHTDFQACYDAVVSYWGFGPWMGWKVADMAERVLCYPVDFSNSDMGIYKDPVQGAAFIDFGDKYYPISMDELHACVDRMVGEFSAWAAPPWNDRLVNEQEIETILCKYKAHCYGFYPLNNDTYHVKQHLVGWGDLAQQLAVTVPYLVPHHDEWLKEDKYEAQSCTTGDASAGGFD